MFGKILLLVTSILLFGCAKPKYENIISNNNDSSIPGQKLTNCSVRFQNSGHCVTWSWEQAPTTSQPGVLIFKILRPNLLDDSAIPVDTVTTPVVLLWMPSMGHGSTPTTVSKVDIGSYRVSNVFFIMPGE